jgi:HEPN domain-containing protein
MDVSKQVDYWRIGGREDLAAAKSLLEKGHLRHGLFFAHLAMEKLLKAHVTRQTKDVPPRIHNLARLAEIAKLSISSEQSSFLNEFGVYQLEECYPDSVELNLDPVFARGEISRAEELLNWLIKQL